MLSYDDPENMTPDELREEVAELLAKGFLRTFMRGKHTYDDQKNAEPSTEKRLDFSGAQSVHRHDG